MNIKIISSFLGFVAILLGVGMFLSTLWSLSAYGRDSYETSGCNALFYSGLICLAVGGIFMRLGHGYSVERLYMREAFACVSLSWFLSILLGATPFLLANIERVEGVPFTVGDAVFESASGFTTTGGSVFGELEDPKTLPRVILFWRSLTHFFGGLGVMCCFVVFLGKGASGKAVLKVEHIFSGNLPFTRMRSLAFSLFVIYLSVNLACFAWFLICGMGAYDAISHAISVTALGGFSTHNESVGYYESQPGVHYVALEYGTTFFMILSGINYWLLFWAALGSFSKLFRDKEWQFYMASFFTVAILTFVLGIHNGGFVLKPDLEPNHSLTQTTNKNALVIAENKQPSQVDLPVLEIVCDEEELNENAPCSNCSVVCDDLEDAFRKSIFHTASLMTSAGFATERYECWNGATILLFMCVMFMGGSSGSPAGGVKVNRMLLTLKLLHDEPERRFRPNVVKTTKYGQTDVDSETAVGALKYLGYLALLIVITTALVSAIEPKTMWLSHDRPQIEKLFDIFGGSLAMFCNTGLAFGEFGSAGNYGNLTTASKLVFSWAMVVGRLEIWCVLALFSRKFWNNR